MSEFQQIMERAEWTERAACRNSGNRPFFPQRGQSIDEAKAMCNICPVRMACLTFAINNNEKFGIWGGKSERQRRAIRRRLRLSDTEQVA